MMDWLSTGLTPENICPMPSKPKRGKIDKGRRHWYAVRDQRWFDTYVTPFLEKSRKAGRASSLRRGVTGACRSFFFETRKHAAAPGFFKVYVAAR